MYKSNGVLVRAVSICAVMILLIGCPPPTQPYSLADRLPDGVKALEDFSDTSGMDGFYLVKAAYSSEHDIDRICDEFRLLPWQDHDGQLLGVAGIIDERFNIPWFPLPNFGKVYYFCSFNDDGSWKDNVSGRYSVMLWVDEERKELIIQMAGM